MPVAPHLPACCPRFLQALRPLYLEAFSKELLRPGELEDLQEATEAALARCGRGVSGAAGLREVCCVRVCLRVCACVLCACGARACVCVQLGCPSVAVAPEMQMLACIT